MIEIKESKMVGKKNIGEPLPKNEFDDIKINIV